MEYLGEVQHALGSCTSLCRVSVGLLPTLSSQPGEQRGIHVLDISPTILPRLNMLVISLQHLCATRAAVMRYLSKYISSMDVDGNSFDNVKFQPQ